jgi:hypothetical protein
MELTQRQANKYKKADKRKKGEIITRYCELTKVSRNLTSKRFRKVIRNPYPRILKVNKEKGKKCGRKPKYTNVHKKIVRKAWELSGEICGERLHPVIGKYISQLEKSGELKYYERKYVRQSKEVSERTLKRIISSFPKVGKRRKSKGNAAIYKAIPIKAHFGKNAHMSGFFEIDYVEHSGGNSSGTFANTGTYVDVCLGWIARSVALGKNVKGVGKIHEANERKIFHKVYEYHPDNAKPILKLLLERKLNSRTKRGNDYQISRSRPYHKEDNGHVEQKNGDKVRKLVGYHRYDTGEQVRLLNRLYNVEDTISNFFIPSQKLIRKVKDEKGRVVSRKYDKAKTAYQRLMEAKDVSKEVKRKLSKMYNSLNLVELRRKSEKLQNQLFQTVIS